MSFPPRGGKRGAGYPGGNPADPQVPPIPGALPVAAAPAVHVTGTGGGGLPPAGGAAAGAAPRPCPARSRRETERCHGGARRGLRPARIHRARGAGRAGGSGGAGRPLTGAFLNCGAERCRRGGAGRAAGAVRARPGAAGRALRVSASLAGPGSVLLPQPSWFSGSLCAHRRAPLSRGTGAPEVPSRLPGAPPAAGAGPAPWHGEFSSSFLPPGIRVLHGLSFAAFFFLFPSFLSDKNQTLWLCTHSSRSCVCEQGVAAGSLQTFLLSAGLLFAPRRKKTLIRIIFPSTAALNVCKVPTAGGKVENPLLFIHKPQI